MGNGYILGEASNGYFVQHRVKMYAIVEQTALLSHSLRYFTENFICGANFSIAYQHKKNRRNAGIFAFHKKKIKKMFFVVDGGASYAYTPLPDADDNESEGASETGF